MKYTKLFLRVIYCSAFLAEIGFWLFVPNSQDVRLSLLNFAFAASLWEIIVMRHEQAELSSN